MWPVYPQTFLAQASNPDARASSMVVAIVPFMLLHD